VIEVIDPVSVDDKGGGQSAEFKQPLQLRVRRASLAISRAKIAPTSPGHICARL
jgi:hypothetical protein